MKPLNNSGDYYRAQVEDMVLRIINDSDLPRFVCIERIAQTLCVYFFESSQSASKAGFTAKNFNILSRWVSPYHTILHISKIV